MKIIALLSLILFSVKANSQEPITQKSEPTFRHALLNATEASIGLRHRNCRMNFSCYYAKK